MRHLPTLLFAFGESIHPTTAKTRACVMDSPAQVVFCSFCVVVRRGMELSAEFDSGGPRHGSLRRLNKGWLNGRSVVRYIQESRESMTFA